MKITEVRIKLMDEPGERLKAFCSITFDDCFVIRDLKIIDGTSGFFVAMPSRKLTSHCFVCHYKNPIRASYCNQCGAKLPMQMPTRDEDGRAKLYADIAHPINSAAREMIQREVIAAYEEEKVRAQAPGYVSRYDEYDMDFDDEPMNDSMMSPMGRMGGMNPMDRMSGMDRMGGMDRMSAMERMDRMAGMDRMGGMGRMSAMERMDRMSGMDRMGGMGRMSAMERMDRMAGIDRMAAMDRMAGMDRMNCMGGMGGMDRMSGMGEMDRMSGMSEMDRMSGMGEMDRMMSSVPSQASVPPAELQDELEEPEELVQPEQNEAPRETDDFGAGIFDEN
ncbi:MAG: hypothetical protein E7029_02085 [Planctomycetaceae bacterium]|nr:hypothetical protein [Planctomycetaceae bacterium]